MDAPHPGGLGGTYSGNPLACVAALGAIDQINQPDFLAQARDIGATLRTRLGAIQRRHPEVIGDVRGVGPMLVMELVKDPDTKEPWMEAASAITAETVRNGVITIRAGLYSNCVRFLPPLVISNAELAEALHVLDTAVDTVVEDLAG